MKVLIGCEESQVVCKAFRNKGHEAYSCDILEPSGEHPEWHIQDDILNIVNDSWDLFIVHPPCDHLSVAGASFWKYEWKQKAQQESLEFIRKLLEVPIEKIALENPVGKINTAIRKPDQIIHPYQFGDPFMKRTCLWLKKLPLLDSTDIVEPLAHWVTSGKKSRFNNVPEGAKSNRKLRSRTFEGIAKAMADQWG